jgi:hypothetical protein
MLDIRYVTGEDIEKRAAFASRIGATVDPARCLTLGPG